MEAKQSLTERIATKLNAFNQRLEARLRKNQTLLENMRAEEDFKKSMGYMKNSLDLRRRCNMENIYDKDYAPFMEDALQSMVQMPITGICIISRLKDGSVFTQYHNSTTMDKMIYAGVIQQDITMDVMKAYNKAKNDQGEEKE